MVFPVEDAAIVTTPDPQTEPPVPEGAAGAVNTFAATDVLLAETQPKLIFFD